MTRAQLISQFQFSTYHLSPLPSSPQGVSTYTTHPFFTLLPKKKKKKKKPQKKQKIPHPPFITHLTQKPTNRILAHDRPGGGRSTADFNTLCEKITEGWNRIVETQDEKSTPDRELRAVFILGTIVAGQEAGFVLPPVRYGVFSFLLRMPSAFFLSFCVWIVRHHHLPTSLPIIKQTNKKISIHT